jgi:hypothetical protein
MAKETKVVKTEAQKIKESSDREIAQEYPDKSKTPAVDAAVLAKAKELLKGMTEAQKSAVVASMTIEVQEARKQRIETKKKWYDVYLKARTLAVDYNNEFKEERLTAEAAIKQYVAEVTKFANEQLELMKTPA